MAKQVCKEVRYTVKSRDVAGQEYKARENNQCQVDTIGRCRTKYATTTNETVQDMQCGEEDVQSQIKDGSLTKFIDQRNCDQEHSKIDLGLQQEYLA